MINAEEARNIAKNWKTHKVYFFIKEAAEQGKRELVITDFFFDGNPTLLAFLSENLGYKITFDKIKVIYKIEW